MSSFKDFWNKKNGSDQPERTSSKSFTATVSQGINSIAASSFSLEIKRQITNKFGEDISNYVTSDEVISTLSDRVGKPQPEETEEEFIERASNVLRKILEEKFKF